MQALAFHNISNSNSIFKTYDSIFNSSNPAFTSDTSTHCTASAPTSNNHTLTVLYTNCRSMSPKIDHLLPCNCHICETWLDENISNDELFTLSYSHICHDRTKNGDGIALYITDIIPFRLLAINTLDIQSVIGLGLH